MSPLCAVLLLSWLCCGLSQLSRSQYRLQVGLFAGTPSTATPVPSRSSCARRCTNNPCCGGFTYASNGSCEIFAHEETCLDASATALAEEVGSYRLTACYGMCSQQCGSTNPSTSGNCSGSLAYDQDKGSCYYDYSQCTTTQTPTTTTPEPTTSSTTALTTAALTTTTTAASTAAPTTTEASTTTTLTTTVAPTTTTPPPTTAPAPTTTQAPATTGASSSQCAVTSFVCPTDTTQYHFAKEDNCRQFYKCSNGCPVVFDCAAPLSYNSAISNCDWDYNTGCADPPLT